MNFSLKHGSNFYQWDKGRVLIVHDPDVDEVHFTNEAVTEAVERAVYEKDGLRLVDVPDELLCCGCTLTAYAYKCDGGSREYTSIHEKFRVIARKQPDEGEKA